MGKVIAVCTSDRKGIQKKDVSTAHFSAEWGIDGDAHAGKWHRQISLLSADKIEAFNKRGANVILKQQLMRLCDQRQLDLILVTGGAGSAAQEAMSAVSDKPAPSIASAVIRGKTLIAADPEEHMDALMDSAPQVMESLRNGR